MPISKKGSVCDTLTGANGRREIPRREILHRNGGALEFCTDCKTSQQFFCPARRFRTPRCDAAIRVLLPRKKTLSRQIRRRTLLTQGGRRRPEAWQGKHLAAFMIHYDCSYTFAVRLLLTITTNDGR